MYLGLVFTLVTLATFPLFVSRQNGMLLKGHQLPVSVDDGTWHVAEFYTWNSSNW